MNSNFIPFTEEMKKDYTILVPNMLPMHFKLMLQVFENCGYKMDLLETQGQIVKDTGLKYVHNDTCYPAILVIGQFINAIQSGKYDPHKVALVLFQTGGGCRASNYISLLRKALEKAGYGYVPVISLSLAGIEKHPGFKISVGTLIRLMYAVLYGDLLMSLVNQCKPYEIVKGESEALADIWTTRLANDMQKAKGLTYKSVKENYVRIIKEFELIPKKFESKVLVGVVGEIYVKYSPLGNNNLEQFLVDEGAEVVIPGLLDFCMYCVYNSIVDRKKYGRGKLRYPIIKIAFKFLLNKQKDMIDIIKRNSSFTTPTPFEHTISLTKGYIDLGTKMGEGWLLTAEMLELGDKGVTNVVCTQPFGCLPNHICGKGMIKPIKAKNKIMNIVPIDYDAGATSVNQENRLKLMLANARTRSEEQKKEAVTV